MQEPLFFLQTTDFGLETAWDTSEGPEGTGLETFGLGTSWDTSEGPEMTGLETFAVLKRFFGGFENPKPACALV